MPYEFGKILKGLRNQSGLSVKQVSSELTKKGIKASDSTIYSWENDNSQPTPGAFLMLCEMYGVKDILKTFGYDSTAGEADILPTLQELKLVERYRLLDDRDKGVVRSVLEMAEKRSGKQAEKPHLMPIAAHNDDDSPEQIALMKEDLEDL